jgi:hypothetical protein
MKFQDWIAIREQQIPAPGQNGQQPVSAGMKDNKSKINTRVKQVIAGNLTKPPAMRKKALENLGKQVALDPNSKPEDLESIADLISPAKKPMSK